MRPFRFCPDCGAPLDQPSDGNKVGCSSCGRTYYRNASPTAGAVIARDGRALVTRRAQPPEKGRWDIPGGFLEHDEGPLEALKRELQEELGVTVEVSFDDFVQAVPHQYGDEGDWVLALGFRARLVDGEPTAGDDVADARWVSLEQLDELDFAWQHDKELVRKVLQDG